MKGICRFCEQRNDLKNNLVTPIFISTSQKKSSVENYLYEQKRCWFCQECIDILTQWDDLFAEKIIHPLNTQQTGPVDYQAWLLKFCVSLSWRALNFYIAEGGVLPSSVVL